MDFHLSETDADSKQHFFFQISTKSVAKVLSLFSSLGSNLSKT